jgi:hypothetical protein
VDEPLAKQPVRSIARNAEPMRKKRREVEAARIERRFRFFRTSES